MGPRNPAPAVACQRRDVRATRLTRLTQHPSSAENRHLADVPPRARRFVVDGVAWSVRAALNPYDRRSRPDLIFESEAIVRRVRNYPSHWESLPDEELFALSGGR